MTIPGVPQGYEIRTVYDAQSLADAIVQGDQRLQPGERVVCAIIRRIEPVCTWQHGVFTDGWLVQDKDGYVWLHLLKPTAMAKNGYWVHGPDESLGIDLLIEAYANPPKFRDDLPWTERIQQVGPTIEAQLRGEG